MPNPFCLIPQYADAFLAKVKSGELKPDALAHMTSKDRHAAFAEIMGDANAAHVNASFESRLLLRNQQAGISRWVENAKDLSLPAKRDLLSRVERLDAVLDPANSRKFLADLAQERLGFSVSLSEAGKITEMAQQVTKAREAMEKGGDRMEYGRAKIAFGNYTSDLKNAAAPSITKSAREVVRPGRSASDRLSSAAEAGAQTLKDVPGFTKSVKAAFDNSAVFRQGWRVMLNHPTIWQRNARQSFKNLVDQFGGKAVMDEVNAEIISRPNAMNGMYHNAKLAIAVVEDMFPSTLPEKLPVIGRFYKASETAFNAFQFKNRADVFDKYIEIAKDQGRDVRDRAFLEEVGNVVNSMTARGKLGPLEPAANVTNNIFFSARKVKGDIDSILLQPLGMGGVNGSLNPAKMSFAQKIAVENLAKTVGGTALMLLIAKAVAPESVDFDFRSSNAGKIRIGGTRFDMTGGASAILTLAARIATWSAKNASTGKVSKINSGEFGSTTGMDLLYNFLENKLSPVASVGRDVMKGQDFAGNKPTVGGEMANLLVPLPITNTQELLYSPHGAPVIAGILADALGIGTNTWQRKSSVRTVQRGVRLTPNP